MRVLFDVTHPALVHLFENPARELADRGHAVAVAAREKDVTTQLLDATDIPYTVVSRARGGPLARAGELAVRTVGLARLSRQFEPTVVVSQVDPAAVYAARLAGANAVVFDDSEPERVAAAATHRFADVVCTPRGFGRETPNQRRYDGFHELAYLHPERFEPDRAALCEHGVDPESRYAVLRFVSWEAHHDLGRGGLSPAAKRRLVDELAEIGDVYVTSEDAAGAPPNADALPVPPERFHDLLACADCYAGDSQTTATEAAVLGVPAVRTNSFAGDGDMSNFRELEADYGLLESFADEDAAVSRAVDLFRDPPRERQARRRARLVADKVDVAAFVADTVEGVA
ncbi:hypothetical protein [Halobacterium litoreum]|uniref:DUF354 domain-containing protein n=1 Tax=Halobacterium litoreum TaxID=2039234 RepID=A0ABD5N9B3_9EURY|nr:hypothetical protein [Halobacterium litoreum]UHH12132.1 hypothetical protein LT972_08180 [Halobacterium litoreum]